LRETEFIKQNKDKWERYERALENNNQDPELLKQLYIHTTDDLSYSRTFYPNRSVPGPMNYPAWCTPSGARYSSPL